MKNSRILTALSIGAMLIGLSCAVNPNYADPNYPVYRGRYADTVPQTDTLQVVLFNIKYARHVDTALDLLQNTPGLRNASVLLLQELNSIAADTIARVLEMNYVYIPATAHIMAGHDFGNAVMAKWPLKSVKKLILPHRNPINRSIRIGAFAEINVDNQTVQLASVHLETPLTRPEKKIDQIKAVAGQLAPYSHAVVGGDFNTTSKKSIRAAAKIMTSSGLESATAGLGFTAKTGPFGLLQLELDHIFQKGFSLVDRGKIIDFSASDHAPVWITLLVESTSGH